MNAPQNGMISLHVDFSVFTENEAIGRVAGSISLPIVPQIGDKILFPLLPHGFEAEDSGLYDGYVTQLFSVEDRIITVNNDVSNIVFLLKDITVSTCADAHRIMRYFESAYGLFGDCYDL